jgi:hypothetical protein
VKRESISPDARESITSAFDLITIKCNRICNDEETYLIGYALFYRIRCFLSIGVPYSTMIAITSTDVFAAQDSASTESEDDGNIHATACSL